MISMIFIQCCAKDCIQKVNGSLSGGDGCIAILKLAEDCCEGRWPGSPHSPSHPLQSTKTCQAGVAGLSIQTESHACSRAVLHEASVAEVPTGEIYSVMLFRASALCRMR